MQRILLPLALVAGFAITPDVMAENQSRDLAGFQAINSQGVYNLQVKGGQKYAVTIDGPIDEINKIKTSVSGDTLNISTAGKGSSHLNEFLTITVQMPTLKSLRTEGVGSTQLSQISGEQLDIYYQGVGSLSASGQVRHLVLNAKGVGLVNTRELSAKQVDVSLDGVGSVDVKATESLNARVDGIGSLTYYGKPQRVNKSANGIGGVRAGE